MATGTGRPWTVKVWVLSALPFLVYDAFTEDPIRFGIGALLALAMYWSIWRGRPEWVCDVLVALSVVIVVVELAFGIAGSPIDWEGIAYSAWTIALLGHPLTSRWMAQQRPLPLKIGERPVI